MATEKTKEAPQEQAIVLPDFVKSQLDKIDWDRMKESYGIDKEKIYSNPRLASQIANGEVTDIMQMRLNVANVGHVYVEGAFQVRYGRDKEPDVRYIQVEREPKLFINGEELRSERIRERLLETYTHKVQGEDGTSRKEERYAYANGGYPITLTFENKETGEKEPRKYLVSFDAPMYNKEGKHYRGTQRLFLISCKEVENYLKNVGKSLYNHTFTEAEISALVEGKDIYIEDFTNSKGEKFDYPVQFDAVSRRVVPVNPSWFRELQAKKRDMAKGESAKVEKPAEKAAEKAAEKTKKGVKRG
ncbi:MAG: hypothetical protein PUC72_00975 [Bacteroidales bacterium]|nr:hypothetical protein [Bacteroidales bacterium]